MYLLSCPLGFYLASLVFGSQFQRTISSLSMAWMPNYHVSRIISLDNSRSVILEHQMPRLDDDPFARLGAQVYIEEQTSIDQETFRCKRVHAIEVFRTSSFDPMI